jgi:hypothetical protein
VSRETITEHQDEPRRLTVFGVTALDLVRRLPFHPDAVKGALAAERFLLDMESLETAPGVEAGDLAAIAGGITALAAEPGNDGNGNHAYLR